jgi:iron complex outermembrane receptor protein
MSRALEGQERRMRERQALGRTPAGSRRQDAPCVPDPGQRGNIGLCATTGVAATLALPGLAVPQDDVLVQEKVTVTGSRIKRVDTEGPAPISVITREDIDASGEIAIADILRQQSFNSFGSFRQRSGATAQSQAVVNMRGLGGQRTLVLLDGRRVTGSPTFNGGAAVNLNTIPLAAVERIEVLRDGASAIYGSDAIGGVVNIITRKDYEGLHLSAGMGRPTQTGGDEDSYSLVGGVSGAKGNITFGFEAQQRDILFLSDRDFTVPGLSAFGYPGSYFAYMTAADPRNPTGTFLSLGTFPDPRCPAELNTPAFPDARLQDFGTPIGIGRCQYNYAAVASNEAENDTKSFFVNANYDISATTSFFARGTFTYNESFARYAPTPFTSPFPTLSQDNPDNPTHPALNPTNVFGDPFAGQAFDLDGDGQADVEGPFDLSAFYRNIPGGPRDSFVEDVLVDYLAGVRGTVDWLGGLDWEFGAQYSWQKSESENPGLGAGNAIQALIDAGRIDLFAANTDTGDFERGLDPAFLDAAEAASATSTSDNQTRIVSTDFTVSFDAARLPNGPLPVALGAEYRDEDFDQQFDEQTTAGNFQGTGPGINTGGGRVVKALFGEATIPVLGELDLNLAGRWEDYNDFGTTFNPKVTAAFRPLDSLMLRASWGTGFRAPSMTELYEASETSFGFGIDSVRCAETPNGDPETGRDRTDPSGRTLVPGNPCRATTYQNVVGGNRDLDAEESTNWTVGLVWSPLDDLAVTLDWYDIELEKAISQPAAQILFDEELDLRQAGETGVPVRTVAGDGLQVGKVVRNPRSGRVVATLQNVSNVGKTETDGLDLEGSYSFRLGPAGDFRTTIQWTWVNEYEIDEADGNGLEDPRRFFDPDNRGTVGLNWALGDLGANLLWHYISDTSIEDIDGTTFVALDSWSTWDLSFSYATPWNGVVTLGARNLFDEDPPTSLNVGAPFYSNYLHDIYGRIPYVRYEQDL